MVVKKKIKNLFMGYDQSFYREAFTHYAYE